MTHKMKKLIQYITFFIVGIGSFNSVFGQAASIQAQHSVSPSGGLTYQVPFDVPDYVLGHFPDLGLAFNSQGGDGVAGYGWNISGLSTISRTANTLHHDGFIDPIDFDENDRFSLDGQRLILKTGTYGVSGSEYITEKYSNTKILAVGSSSISGVSGPQYFVVYQPSGLIYWYGKNLESNLSTQSKLEWGIARIEDSQGNEVNFNYRLVNKTLRLDSVTDPVAKVSVNFEYGSKQSVNPIGIGGEFFTNDRLLTDIRVNVNNTTLYNHYNLNHGQTSYGIDCIDHVTQKNRNGEALPDLKFKYFNPTVGEIEKQDSVRINLEAEGIEIGDNGQTATITGDFNGDQNLDFLFYEIDREETDNKEITYVVGDNNNLFNKVSLTSQADFDEVRLVKHINSAGELATKDGLLFIKKIEGTNRVTFNVKSIEGNRLKTEQMRDFSISRFFNEPHTGLSNTVNITGTINSSLGHKDYNGYNVNASNLISSNNEINYFARNNILMKDGFHALPGANFNAQIDSELSLDERLNKMEYVTGDFNGDGVTDVLAMNYIHTDYTVENCEPGLLGPDEVDEPCDRGTIIGQQSTQTEIHFIDFNPLTSNGSSVKLSGGGGIPGLEESDKILTGDFDGDGKTDIFKIRDSALDVYKIENNNIISVASIFRNNIGDKQILPGDYNGDGKTDIAIPVAEDSSAWDFYISNGTEFEKHSKDIGVEYNQSYFTNDYPFPLTNGLVSIPTFLEYSYIPIDYNKDGKTDIIRHAIISPAEESVTWYHPATGAPIITDLNVHGIQKLDYFTNNSSKNNYLDFSKKNVVDDLNAGRVYRGHAIFNDFTGSNLTTEYGYLNTDGKISLYEYTGFHTAELCITEVQNNGFITSFEYEGLEENTQIDDGSIFKNTYSTRFSDNYLYPYAKINSIDGFKVIKSVKEEFSGHTRTKEYRYSGLVSSANGLGILGFNYTAISDWQTADVNAFWTVTKFDLKNRGLVDATWTIASKPNSSSGNTIPSSSYISKTIYGYEHFLNSNKTFGNIPKQITQSDGLTGVVTTTNNTYDDFYNIKNSFISYPGGSKSTTLTYDNNPTGTGTDYFIGRRITKTEKTTLGSETFTTSTEHNFVNNFIKTTKLKGNNTSWLTETFEHDNFGNIIQKTVSGVGVVDRVEKFKYDTATGRFLEKTTTNEGLETNYVYNKSFGHLLKETDHFNRSQSFQYDGWNRLTLETDHLNNTIITRYTNTSSNLFLVTRTSSINGYLGFTYYNRAGMVTSSGVTNELGSLIKTSFVYDGIGRVKRESQPYISGSPSLWTTYTYDYNNMLFEQIQPSGKTITTTYNGLKVTVSDGLKTVSSTQDAIGNKVRVTDPGGTINYTYHANNSLKTTNYNGHIITTDIDGWGRKEQLSDPAAGIYSYTYNILGELLTETTPKGKTTYVYDDYGKPLNKTIKGFEGQTDLELSYTYYETNKMLDKLIAEDKISGKDFTYDYDYHDDLKIKSVIETTPLAVFKKEVTYDIQGRSDVETITTNSTVASINNSIRLQNQYHPSTGHLIGIKDVGSNSILWEIKGVNEYGALTQIDLANGITKSHNYNELGIPTQFTHKSDTATILDLALDFDTQTGNLKSRYNKAFTGEEVFTYDELHLDRLETITTNGILTHTQEYNNDGNININSNVGTYEYDPTTKYRVSGIDLNGLGETYYDNHTPQKVIYNAFKKPVSIHEEGNGRVDFEYGPLKNRSVAYYGGNDEDINERDFTKIYSSIAPVELIVDNENNNSKIITYVGGDGYSAPVVHITKDVEEEFLYLHRDHLGSIMSISNSQGELVEQTHYGAWGKVEKYWSVNGGDTLDYASVLGRGYTGHEHFGSVGLIHMNGRMYDANLGRFLSPDNFIQDPYNTQSFNRYSYVWNNPLKYNDPSGESLIAIAVGVAIGALIGAGTAAVTYAIIAANTGNWDWGAFGLSVLGGAITGAISGGIGAESLISSIMTSTSTGAFIGGSIAVGVIVSMLPGVSVPVGDFTFSISPAIAFGNAAGIGANFTATYSDGDFSISAGIGITKFSRAHGTGASTIESRYSIGGGYDDGNFRASISTTKFNSNAGSEDTGQRVANLSLGYQDFGISYENDGSPFNKLGKTLVNNTDKFRTAALSISYKDYSVGFNLFTGSFEEDKGQGIEEVQGHTNRFSLDRKGNRVINVGGQYAGENASRYRLGALYAGYKGYRYGVNSEKVRSFIQNKVAHTAIAYQPWFKVRDIKTTGYFQYQSPNQFTSW